jgi:hypothetical protein
MIANDATRTASAAFCPISLDTEGETLENSRKR